MLTKTLIATAALTAAFGLTACDRSVNAEDGSPRVLPTADGSEWTESGGALREEIDAQLAEGEELPTLPENARCLPDNDLGCVLVLPGETGYDDALSPYHP
ncbi:hypothetical protein ABQE48_13040 [Mycolicibacterium thermoresistibile]